MEQDLKAMIAAAEAEVERLQADGGRMVAEVYGLQDGSQNRDQQAQIARLTAERDRLAGLLQRKLDGSRDLPLDRDLLGRMVREAWVKWARTQPDPKPSWLVPYDELSETDKEADRQIGEHVARWTLIHDAAEASYTADAYRPTAIRGDSSDEG